MPVTELALLRLTSGTTLASILPKLAHAKHVMEDYTHRSFYYFQQVEDPTLIYIVGEWDSLDQHTNHFIPCAQNQEVLQSLKDDVTVEWLVHIGVAQKELHLEEDVVEIEIGRYQVKIEEKEAFEADRRTSNTLKGGWRVDGEEGKNEWVAICSRQTGFWANVREWEGLDGADVKNARALEGRRERDWWDEARNG